MPVMDMKQFKKRLDEICKLCDVSPEAQAKWQKYLDSIKTRPLADELTSIVKEHSDALKRLNDTFMHVNQRLAMEYQRQEKPLIIFHPTDPTQLRIYHNVIISSSNIEDINNLTVLDLHDAFKGFYKAYDEDMAIPGGSEKWATKERIEKRLNAYTDMPTTKALSRYTNFDQKYAATTIIRDFAAMIDEERKPMELSYADTPADWCIVYGSGPSSCMSLNGGNAQRFQWMWDANFCPASFYAHFPYTRGAYIIKNGRVLARTVLFKYPDRDVWQYGRIYADSPIQNKFKATLEAAGHKPLSNKRDWTPHEVFEIPDGTSFNIKGYKYKKEGIMCMPWPYFDNMDYNGKGFYASYDQETNEFTITYHSPNSKGSKKEEDMLPIQIQDGVLLSIDYSERKCYHCGTLRKDKRFDWITSADGKCFDSAECLIAAGYVKVRTIQAEQYQLPNEHLVPIQGFKGTVFFSTVEAATKYGFYPILRSDGSVPEEGDIEVTNKYNGKRVIGKSTWVYQMTELPENPKLDIIFNDPIRNVSLDIDEEEYKGLSTPTPNVEGYHINF